MLCRHMYILRLTIISVLTFLLCALGSQAQLNQASIDSIFAAYNQPAAPGASVVVVQNGTILFEAGYGFADIKRAIPVATDTAFHLASVGKEMTALAILMLGADGKLSIDDSVAKYLPQFKGWGSKVKIRNLLYHTGGIPDYYEDIEEHYRRPSNLQALKYLAQLARLKFRPGARFDYSNSGYDTLAAIIEKVSGQKFADFMNLRVFSVAQMSNTFAFDKARRSASKRALGYGLDHGEYYLDDTSPLNDLHGSGSIYSTVEDMAKYDNALFSHQFVSKQVLDQAFVTGRLNNGRALDYGFGWDLLIDSDLNQAYYGHSGEWMGFSSYYLHYPNLNLSVIVLSNSSSTDAESLAFQTAKVVVLQK